MSTEAQKGRSQLISSINACQTVANAVRPTLGPQGIHIYILEDQNKVTTSNDGATIIKQINVVHPAAKTLVNISCSQDAKIDDGTKSVVLLAAEFLKQSKSFVEEGIHPQTLIRSLRKACKLCLNKIDEVAIKINKSNKDKLRNQLDKCAQKSLSSKLVSHQKNFFSKLVVDAVMQLDESLPLNMIGIKKVQGGTLEDSLLISGVAFKKTFSYDDFEMQPKNYSKPKIALLDIELELRAERDNAEVCVDNVTNDQVPDVEKQTLPSQLDKIRKSGAKIVLSKQPIDDDAVKYFADYDIFCTSSVADDDLRRTMKTCGGSIITAVSDIKEENLGSCELFEEMQIGSERYNAFTGCPNTKTVTFILRGGSENITAEAERYLHDAIKNLRIVLENDSIVAGGGAIEMELSKCLRDHSRTVADEEKSLIDAIAKSFEIIPKQLCDNAGCDATKILDELIKNHENGRVCSGVDIFNDIKVSLVACVWELSVVKKSAITAATEACCLILNAKETIDLSDNPNLYRETIDLSHYSNLKRHFLNLENNILRLENDILKMKKEQKISKKRSRFLFWGL